MALGRDSTSKRFQEILRDKQPAQHGAEQLIDSEIFAPAGTSFDKFMNFESENVHGAASWVALRLGSADEDSVAILAAFAAGGLNHRNPFHWRVLLAAFSEAHFGKRRTKPIIWDTAALCEVFVDYFTVKNEGKVKTNPQIHRVLRSDKRFKDKYQKYHVDAFRKLVRYALSPKHNPLLRHPEMEDPVLQLFRESYEGRGGIWTPQVQGNFQRLIDKAMTIVEAQKQTKT